ncbi:helix-turn-helix transcriptional regulator [Clostridium sp. DMHC 10]|uniref:helix-turn-helix domain-containing protein n=1 Tax=Clostridium sp. DMHC 10 TaxID=747377 RepID=UPI00069E9DAA|nr:helix-turn-helix transcriptional regulator [Clostridium sp. DMHC 10]
MDFYKILLKIMNEKSLTIPDVSRATGLSDSTIRSIISRKAKNVTLEVAFKISKGLDVSLERLNGDNPSNSNLIDELNMNEAKLSANNKGLIEDSLKEIILSKYKSLREFTIKIGMPYSTFDTILKRGVDKANIINILKICDELNISADKLAIGIIENKNSNQNDLTQDQATLLDNYNKLNTIGKKEANKRVSELTCIPMYSDSEITATSDKSEKILEGMYDTIAAHDDDLTPDEKEEMNRRILDKLNKLHKDK